jgi:hypothetical protein
MDKCIINTLFFASRVSFRSHEVYVVLIKIEMVSSLKFHLKLKETLHQHKSNIVTCYIINFLIFFLKI